MLGEGWGGGGGLMKRCVGALLARLNLLIGSGGSDESARERAPVPRPLGRD